MYNDTGVIVPYVFHKHIREDNGSRISTGFPSKNQGAKSCTSFEQLIYFISLDLLKGLSLPPKKAQSSNK